MRVNSELPRITSCDGRPQTSFLTIRRCSVCFVNSSRYRAVPAALHMGRSGAINVRCNFPMCVGISLMPTFPCAPPSRMTVQSGKPSSTGRNISMRRRVNGCGCGSASDCCHCWNGCRTSAASRSRPRRSMTDCAARRCWPTPSARRDFRLQPGWSLLGRARTKPASPGASVNRICTMHLLGVSAMVGRCYSSMTSSRPVPRCAPRRVRSAAAADVYGRRSGSHVVDV